MDTQDEANAALAQAAALVAEALTWYETYRAENGEIVMLHGLLSRIAQRAEHITGMDPGSLNVMPLDGTPKPGSGPGGSPGP